MKDVFNMLNENHLLKTSARLGCRLILMALLALGISVASSGYVLANSSPSVGGACSLPGSTGMDTNSHEILGCFSGIWQRGRTGVINLNTIPTCEPGSGLNFNGRSFICVPAAPEPVNGVCGTPPGMTCVSGNEANFVMSNPTPFNYGNGVTTVNNTETWDCDGGDGGTSQTGCTYTSPTCEPQSVSWTVGDYTCSGTTGLMQGSHTGVFYGSTEGPDAAAAPGNNVGTASYTCNLDGNLTGPSNATCAPFPSCPATTEAGPWLGYTGYIGSNNGNLPNGSNVAMEEVPTTCSGGAISLPQTYESASTPPIPITSPNGASGSVVYTCEPVNDANGSAIGTVFQVTGPGGYMGWVGSTCSMPNCAPPKGLTWSAGGASCSGTTILTSGGGNANGTGMYAPGGWIQVSTPGGTGPYYAGQAFYVCDYWDGSSYDSYGGAAFTPGWSLLPGTASCQYYP